MKIFLSVVITLLVIVLLGGCCLGTGALLYFRNARAVEAKVSQNVVNAPAAQAADPVAPAAPAPVQDPAPAAPATPAEIPFVWNGEVGTLGEYIDDADPLIVGFKVKGAPMTYTCRFNFGVFVSMDPGVVEKVSTKDKGAVVYIPCEVGKVIHLSTEYWNENQEHQSVHMFEQMENIPNVTPEQIFSALMLAEAKPVNLYFSPDGTYVQK